MNKLLCPICGTALEGRSPAEWPYLPFCSKRCKTIDLGHWLDEGYRIQTEETEERTDSDVDDLP